MVCNAFVQAADSKVKGSLLRFIPSAKKTMLDRLPKTNSNLCEGFLEKKELLHRVHPSWLIPFLRNAAENELKLFLTCLSEQQIQKAKKGLLFSSNLPLTSPLGKEYLERLLLEQVLPQDMDLLPIECLPDSSMNRLLSLSEEQIHLVCDFLGLHDLAIEIRQIIDTVKLKKIHSVLSKEQEAYLKNLLQKKESVVFKRMELSKWNGSAETLLSTLRHRGINRLAKALFPEDASLTWHIAHQIDMEEASILRGHCKKLDHANAAHLLAMQTLDIISMIQNQPHTPSL